MQTAAPHWTFLSNHAHVLICIAENPEIRLRDIADKVGITERSAQRIINQLREANILVTEKNGRRNHYLVDVEQELRHPIEAHCKVATLLSGILSPQKVSHIRKMFLEAVT
ncbi:MAG: winged helix-turn-helix transcriptional regulator [Acidiferrobacterales bacterium]|nr:winged helix-turn-helix transcriptional regulator [Acidiferrobacterales bacterium]